MKSLCQVKSYFSSDSGDTRIDLTEACYVGWANRAAGEGWQN